MKGSEHVKKMKRKDSPFYHLNSAININNICVLTYPPIYPPIRYSILFLMPAKVNIVACQSGFPGDTDSKESVCNAGDLVGKIPWRREWQPTPVCLPREFPGQRNLVGYNPWGHSGLQSMGSQRVGHDWVTFTFQSKLQTSVHITLNVWEYTSLIGIIFI